MSKFIRKKLAFYVTFFFAAIAINKFPSSQTVLPFMRNSKIKVKSFQLAGMFHNMMILRGGGGGVRAKNCK